MQLERQRLVSSEGSLPPCRRRRGPDATLHAPDGRTLGWATYGDEGGAPVVALHGSPDSRRTWALLDSAAREHGVRQICPDRPGFGLSDPQPGRTVLDWPADVAAVADHLHLQRFAVLGLSGGGAYACATAWALAERVQGSAAAA